MIIEKNYLHITSVHGVATIICETAEQNTAKHSQNRAGISKPHIHITMAQTPAIIDKIPIGVKDLILFMISTFFMVKQK
jgi:hypothetical protein